MSECSMPDELGPGLDVEGFILDEIRGMALDWCCRKHYNTRPEQILAAYRDQVLHEAAEKIRAKADTFSDWDFTTRRDMREAADLVDHDVEDEEEEGDEL
ncbi:hypothetical protein CP967_31245 [Streptomyces nitrosporeus]|uniref:Uncharacterized protein n=1 Tax=Streptomyces nitrosporeus TaxID=28894 RepID=A0A5J6FHL4_9ACTN|nr:hypothetical protein [Streptomyces nitrosporeus]QEU75848.1 hypothetical protein CP967_31245 [Streptomyces nitrosporeus]GGY88762.1 hypothetical protein GCM10010327_19360 [Streptomyces nitrosporeus]